jgi:uncharacterized protein YdbL (DUF1318 family)
MKSFPRRLWLVTLVVTLAIWACVTINIYFPAEKVESVAGEIVSEVRGQKPENPDNSKEKDDSPEKNTTEEKEKSSLLSNPLLAFWGSLAWADEVTAVSNPTIRALKDAMKRRYPQMKPFYQKGMLGEGDDGYVSLVNSEGLGLKERRDLNNLVEAENNDRKKLYEEVAKALNIDPSQVNRVAEIFAKDWQKTVP